MKIEKIWQEYRAALKQFLHSKVSNDADVEDLLQDILIKTYSKLGNIKNQKSIKAWLFQIANHVIIDFYRKKGRSQKISVEELELADDTDDMKLALSHCIAPFISALPQKHSEILLAVDLQGKSQKEYAKELGISYSTLKSRVQKSRVLLKNIFDDCCHFEMDKNGSIYDYSRKRK